MADTPKQWRVDLRDDPWKDRMIALLCGLGVCIPVGRGMLEKTYPWHWSGDRLAVIALFLAIGVIAFIWDDC